MTTTVKVHVNGNYRATVKHVVHSDSSGPDGEAQPDVIVNPQEEKVLHFRHDARNVFEITEEYLGDKPAA